jgi:hypothetical protein
MVRAAGCRESDVSAQATERRTTRRLSLGRTYIGSSYLLFTPPVGNIVPGVFAPVLAKHTHSNRYYRRIVGRQKLARNGLGENLASAPMKGLNQKHP